MYINTEIYKKSGLTMPEFFILQLIRQKDYNEDEPVLRDVNINYFHTLTTKGWIEEIKSAPKKAEQWEKSRLTKKGKALMRDIEIPHITEQSKRLGAQLVALYQDNGLQIDPNNNKRNVHELVAWYLGVTDFDANQIYAAVEDYINSVDKKFVSMLSNLIWKKPNLYSSHKNLSQSKLYGIMTS